MVKNVKRRTGNVRNSQTICHDDLGTQGSGRLTLDLAQGVHHRATLEFDSGLEEEHGTEPIFRFVWNDRLETRNAFHHGASPVHEKLPMGLANGPAFS